MGVKDTEYLKNEIMYRKVYLIDGRFTRVSLKTLVGKCHNPIHKGYVNVALLNKHDCINKKCPYLEKFEDYPFWVRQRNIEIEKSRKKEKIRQAQQERELEQKKQDEKMENLRLNAQKIADELGYEINITKVALLKEVKKSKYWTKYEYVINYTSVNHYRDSEKFFPLVLRMVRTFGGKYFLRHIRDIDGRYLTTEEWVELNKTKK